MTPAQPESPLEPRVEETVEPYAAAIRKLLKGVVYHDDPAWQQLRDFELPIREYLARIGLSLHLDEIGNFAYLHDESRDEDGASDLPALTSRRALSFNATLLLVLLRERLDEHEKRDIDGTRLSMSADEIREMVGIFMGDHPDARRVESNIQASINRLVSYGYLTKAKQQPGDHYVVRPLLRAKVGADQLEEIRDQLVRHLAQNIKGMPKAETEREDDSRDAESI